MNSQQSASPPLHRKVPIRAVIMSAIAVGIVVMMALDTTVVSIGSEQDQRQAKFSPEAFGQEQFPQIQSWIEEHAVSVEELYSKINQDRASAIEMYGVEAGISAVFPVTFSGTVEEGQTGIYNINVAALPDDMAIRVQTGPAINGTELRDATGMIEFGQFTNQIEYQDAGQAINNVMKVEVLSKVETESLEGAEVKVTGAFTLLNPNNWLVTPVRLEVL